MATNTTKITLFKKMVLVGVVFVKKKQYCARNFFPCLVGLVCITIISLNKLFFIKLTASIKMISSDYLIWKFKVCYIWRKFCIFTVVKNWIKFILKLWKCICWKRENFLSFQLWHLWYLCHPLVPCHRVPVIQNSRRVN